ncbi:MAG: hypothetical protein M1825_003183 [Sarcosagium campestre]|nr:MAG: hypothetical protein M1825_003183 [Sarcosagium campestre]
MQTSTIVAASVGVAATGLVAYAVYFDHRRRTDPEFRKSLKREARRQARIAKEEAEAQGNQRKEDIKAAIVEAKQATYPTNSEESEAFFMNEVARGESIVAENPDSIEGALCFYKALKVYPTPRDLMSIYDKTVPKPTLDILAEMVAADPSISTGSAKSSASSDGEGAIE